MSSQIKFHIELKILILSVLLFIISDISYAQESSRNAEIDRERLEESEKVPVVGVGKFLWKMGFWNEMEYVYSRNDDNNKEEKEPSRTTRIVDSRFWLRFIYRPDWKEGITDFKEHTLYLRLSNEYERVRPKGQDRRKFDDNKGPRLEIGYLDLDFDPLTLRIGRQFISLGGEITYARAHDGIQAVYYPSDLWEAIIFVSKTQPHEENIDNSVPGSGKKSNRLFVGGQMDYFGIKDHDIYSYFLIQKDYSREKPEDESQDYDYNAEYLGVGLKKSTESGFNYWTELIGETGSSYTWGSNVKKDIRAWAYDLGISYTLTKGMAPSCAVRYSLGSGDSDRENVTNTRRGNISGRDNNFLPFGNFFAGSALQPRLSNLQCIGGSVSLYPFYFLSLLKDFNLEVDLFLYYKDKKLGGISDTDATSRITDTVDSESITNLAIPEKNIGKEIDIYTDWPITKNLNFRTEFGYFIPSDAYPKNKNDPELFCSTALSINF